MLWLHLRAGTRQDLDAGDFVSMDGGAKVEPWTGGGAMDQPERQRYGCAIRQLRDLHGMPDGTARRHHQASRVDCFSHVCFLSLQDTLLRYEATIDHQFCASDKGRLVRGEVQGAVGNVVRR